MKKSYIFTVSKKLDAWIEEAQKLDAKTFYQKLYSLMIDKNNVCSSETQFNKRVELNIAFKNNTVSFTIEQRRGYKIISFNF